MFAPRTSVSGGGHLSVAPDGAARLAARVTTGCCHVRSSCGKGTWSVTARARARARLPLGAVTCAWAAGQGHLECLRYAHEHGCTSTAAPGKLTDTCTYAPGSRQGGTSWSACGTRTSTGCCPLESCHVRLGCTGQGGTWSVCGTRTSTAAPGKLSRALGLRGKGTRTSTAALES